MSGKSGGGDDPHALLKLDDAAFLKIWRELEESERALIPVADRAACTERFRKLNPWILAAPVSAQASGGRAGRASRAKEPEPGGLIRTGSGAIAGCEHNAVVLLREAPQYMQLHYDDFLDRPRLGGRDWIDADDMQALVWLQASYHVATFKLGHVRSACAILARERRRDSLREFIEGLEPWDGTERIALAFCDAWGARDSELTRAASKNFFVAAVARAYQPGVQVDTLWVLEGPQGSRKSASLRKLGGEFHAEISAAVGTADFLREQRGLWFAELSELESLRGREASTVKKILSAPVDRYVEKYERQARAYPRRTICVATTNESRYWEDSTGARRLIPIRVGDIDLALIVANRAQWFAEAREAYRQGASWWQFPPSIIGEQDERQLGDPWEDLLREQLPELAPGAWLSSAQVMTDLLKLTAHQQGAASGVRLGRVMRRLGFEPSRKGKRRERGWVKADTSEA